MVSLRKILPELKTVLSTFTLLGLFIAATVFFYFGNGINLSGFFEKEINLANRQIAILTLPPSEFHGWIAWWDEKNAYNSFKTNVRALETISPVWYKINDKGELLTIPHTFEGEIKSLSQDAGVKVIPAITNDFDPNKTYLLADKNITGKLIDKLILEAKNAGFAGFDIDFEEIDPRDQPTFEQFIEEFAKRLRQEDMILTISVHAQTGQITDRAVAKAYNLSKLSKSADFIKIMAYDFHSPGSVSGAVTPMDDLEKVLEYNTSIIPIKKIILGLPTYGYNWSIGSGERAEVVTYNQAREKIASNSGTLELISNLESLVGRYKKDGQDHEIWFEDAQTIQAKIKKGREYGVNQFSFWRIGAEDPKLWQEIKE